MQQAVVGVFLSFHKKSQIFELLSVVVNAVREELEEGSACAVAENTVWACTAWAQSSFVRSFMSKSKSSSSFSNALPSKLSPLYSGVNI